MDPVTLIASAVAVGAAVGSGDTAEQSVTDAYAALKGLLTRRYREVNLAPLEASPDSVVERESTAESLRAQGAADDAELCSVARELIFMAGSAAAESGVVAGVDLERVQAASLRITGVTATGAGVRLRGGRFSGDIEIGNIDAGAGDRSHPGPARRPPLTPPR